MMYKDFFIICNLPAWNLNLWTMAAVFKKLINFYQRFSPDTIRASWVSSAKSYCVMYFPLN